MVKSQIETVTIQNSRELVWLFFFFFFLSLRKSVKFCSFCFLGLERLTLKILLMSQLETIKLLGCSKQEYEFNIYNYGTKFKAVGGVYFISKVNNEGVHSTIYLGITNDLSTRFDNHHKEMCFIDNEVNRISILVEENEENRIEIEKDILCKYDFKCNELNN